MPAPPDDSSLMKERARASRLTDSKLSFKNYAEHQLRLQLKDEALEICKPQIGEFAECAQEKGLMVVWSCRSLHKAVHNCLAVHNGEEAWQKYKLEHKAELESKPFV